MVDGKLMGKMCEMGWILDELFNLVFQKLFALLTYQILLFSRLRK